MLRTRVDDDLALTCGCQVARVFVALWSGLCVAEGRVFSLSFDTERAVASEKKLELGLSEFVLLKMETVLGGIIWEKRQLSHCLQP